MPQAATLQVFETMARPLRLSRKSAAKILPEVREQMVEALLERPDAESITRKFGSTTIQVIFGILWVLAWEVRRLKNRAAVRDGFGRPVGRETGSSTGMAVVKREAA
jgi:hypothetical protein